jgi:hypothetical protein
MIPYCPKSKQCSNTLCVFQTYWKELKITWMVSFRTRGLDTESKGELFWNRYESFRCFLLQQNGVTFISSHTLSSHKLKMLWILSPVAVCSAFLTFACLGIVEGVYFWGGGTCEQVVGWCSGKWHRGLYSIKWALNHSGGMRSSCEVMA